SPRDVSADRTPRFVAAPCSRGQHRISPGPISAVAATSPRHTQRRNQGAELRHHPYGRPCVTLLISLAAVPEPRPRRVGELRPAGPTSEPTPGALRAPV